MKFKKKQLNLGGQIDDSESGQRQNSGRAFHSEGQSFLICVTIKQYRY